jgi:hypothetical protein
MRSIAAVAAVAAVAAAVGCSAGASSSSSGSPTSPPTPAPTLPRHDGLVGAIDAARVVAVCANLRLADTAAAGGLTDAETQALDGAIGVLRQPTAGVAGRDLATRWTDVRHRAGDGAVIRQMQAWCDANGG